MRIVITCLFLLCLSTVAQADTYRESVPRNKTSVVGSTVITAPGCISGGAPNIKVKTQPKHGTVSFKKIKAPMPSGRCAGKVVQGTLVIYKPNRGYKGQDVFKVGFKMDMYVSGSAKIRNVVDKYVITVK